MTQRYAPDPVLSGFKLPNSLLKIQKGSQNDQDSTPPQRYVKQKRTFSYGWASAS